MDINENSMVPIYVQIADAIEDDILSGKLEEGGSCYSQLILAKELHVNPATAAKEINLLVNRGILTRKRGQAMTIAANARKLVENRKRKEEMAKIVDDLVCWGNRLSMSKQEVIELIENKYKELGQ
ncbi:MAG: GntR family transcriptional regulator [Eubacterium sp.]|uniref:GntR family transcriptional regulator n=1 Tax=Eubacterium sp. TaxID=142586 RepID=UPI00300F170D